MHSGKAGGFTLVELMIVLVLLGIIATIAVPNFTGLIRDNQVLAQAEELNSLMQYARSESVIRRRTISVNLDTTQRQASVVIPGPGEEPDTSLRTASFTGSNNISFASSHPQITYRPNGTSTVGNYRATFCRDSSVETGYLLTVVGSGRTILHPKGRNENGASLGGC